MRQVPVADPAEMRGIIEEQRATIRILKESRWVETAKELTAQLIKYGTVCFIAYMGYLSVEALAGKTTASNIVVDFLANVSFSTAVAWGAGGAGGVYGWHQRNLRRKVEARLESRNTALEGQVRSSKRRAKT